MKNLYIFCLFVIAANTSIGQQELQLSNDRFTSLQFNPSQAGVYSDRDIYASGYLSYRNQWLGFEGAPTTYSLNTDYYLEDYKMGLGISLFSDNIGIDNKLEIAGNYSYRIRFDEGALNLGIRTGYSSFGSAFSTVRNVESGDIYDQANARYNIFSVGAGILYHSESLRLGVSIPSIAVLASSDNARLKQRHIYVHSAFKLGDPGDFLRLEPTLLFKYQEAVPIQAKIGAVLWIDESFTPALHYRWGDAFALSLGWLLDERLQLGVAYDFTVSDIRLVSDNSFELQLGYLFR